MTLTLIGALKSRRVASEEDFALAGRRLTTWVLVGTMIATWIGTGSIFGNAGKTYEIGLAAAFVPVGSLLGVTVLVLISAKVRKMKITTVPEIIRNRFGNFAGVLTTVSLTIAYLVIVSYQYNAGGSVLEVILKDSAGNPLVSTGTAVIFAAVFIVAYTLFAGLFSVAYTDVFNSIVIVITFMVSLPLLWYRAGGSSGIETLFLASGRASHLNLWGIFSAADFINFCLPPFLLILGDANMYQRFSAGTNSRSVRKATIYFVVGVLLVEMLIIFTAWVSSAMIPEAENGRHVMVYAAMNLLPPLLGAIMITTIVGIIISTADSYLLIPATTLVKDIYLKYLHPKASERTTLIANRLTVLCLGITAFAVSRGFAESAGFFERALYAYTIYGAAITPALMATLYWKRATRFGIIASMLMGIFMTLAWKEWILQNWLLPDFIRGLDEVLPAALVSTLTLLAVSLITSPKNPDRKSQPCNSED